MPVMNPEELMPDLHQFFSEPRSDGMTYPVLDDARMVGVILHTGLLEGA